MTDVSEADVPPQTNGFGDDGMDEDDRSKIRPADIDADMREMERRKRVEMIMSSRLFREELERIIETQLKDGNGPAGLLQQISDMMGVQGGRLQNTNFFKSSNCVVPINDIRGVESMGYAKGEKILRCKLAAVYRLMDLYGWTQNIYNHITARLNQDQEHFLVNPFGMLYHEITASSLVKVDMQGAVVEQGTTNFGVNVAGFQLHAAVHAARPDIKCIIHLHTPSVLAISSTKCGLIPLCQESIVIGEVSQHNYLGSLHEPEEKDKLARDLGPMSKVMLLTNHGALCCGETIEEAFYNVYNTVLACETQLKLMPIGIENLQLIPDETRKQIYDAARNAPEGTAPPPSQIDKKEKRFRIGGLEFEALMRMMDNAGFRTGYIYRQPLVKGDPPKPRNDVEVPPAVSSLGYLLEEEEMYKHGNWKKFVDGRKSNDRTRWLNSPNVYQKVEILETGTPDPKKITKWVEANAEEWVAEGSPQHSSTPVKIESALQFVPKNTNPKEFKKLQQLIKENRRADKITSGPQSHILEGVSWEEAKKLQDANISQTGDQVILVGAASKGIIQRGFQHNATVYKAPYAKNPFDQVSDAEIEDYKRVVIRKQRGESSYEEDQSESEALSSSAALPPTGIKSPASETEEESRDEPRVLRIETKQVPRPSQAEVVLSDEGDSLESDLPLTQMQRSKSSRYPEKELIKHLNRSNSLGRNQQNTKDLCECGNDQHLLEDGRLFSERDPQNPSWQFLPQVVKVSSGYVGVPNVCEIVSLSAANSTISSEENVGFNFSKKSVCDAVNCGIQGDNFKKSFLPNMNSGMSKLIEDLKRRKIQLKVARLKFLEGESIPHSTSNYGPLVCKRKKINVIEENNGKRPRKSLVDSNETSKHMDTNSSSRQTLDEEHTILQSNVDCVVNSKGIEQNHLSPSSLKNESEFDLENTNYAPVCNEDLETPKLNEDGHCEISTPESPILTRQHHLGNESDTKEEQRCHEDISLCGGSFLEGSPAMISKNNLSSKSVFHCDDKSTEPEGTYFDINNYIVKHVLKDAIGEKENINRLNEECFANCMHEEECCLEKDSSSWKVNENKCTFSSDFRQMHPTFEDTSDYNELEKKTTESVFPVSNEFTYFDQHNTILTLPPSDYSKVDSMAQYLQDVVENQNYNNGIAKFNEVDTEHEKESSELVTTEFFHPESYIYYQEDKFAYNQNSSMIVHGIDDNKTCHTISRNETSEDKYGFIYEYIQSEKSSSQSEDLSSSKEQLASFDRYMDDRYHSDEGKHKVKQCITECDGLNNDEFDPSFNYDSSYIDGVQSISVVESIINLILQEINKNSENESWTNAMYDFDMINANCDLDNTNMWKENYSQNEDTDSNNQLLKEFSSSKETNESMINNLLSDACPQNSQFKAVSCSNNDYMPIMSDVEVQNNQTLFKKESAIKINYLVEGPIEKLHYLQDETETDFSVINIDHLVKAKINRGNEVSGGKLRSHVSDSENVSVKKPAVELECLLEKVNTRHVALENYNISKGGSTEISQSPGNESELDFYIHSIENRYQEKSNEGHEYLRDESDLSILNSDNVVEEMPTKEMESSKQEFESNLSTPNIENFFQKQSAVELIEYLQDKPKADFLLLSRNSNQKVYPNEQEILENESKTSLMPNIENSFQEQSTIKLDFLQNDSMFESLACDVQDDPPKKQESLGDKSDSNLTLTCNENFFQEKSIVDPDHFNRTIIDVSLPNNMNFVEDNSNEQQESPVCELDSNITIFSNKNWFQDESNTGISVISNINTVETDLTQQEEASENESVSDCKRPSNENLFNEKLNAEHFQDVTYKELIAFNRVNSIGEDSIKQHECLGDESDSNITVPSKRNLIHENLNGRYFQIDSNTDFTDVCNVNSFEEHLIQHQERSGHESYSCDTVPSKEDLRHKHLNAGFFKTHNVFSVINNVNSVKEDLTQQQETLGNESDLDLKILSNEDLCLDKSCSGFLQLESNNEFSILNDADFVKKDFTQQQESLDDESDSGVTIPRDNLPQGKASAGYFKNDSEINSDTCCLVKFPKEQNISGDESDSSVTNLEHLFQEELLVKLQYFQDETKTGHVILGNSVQNDLIKHQESFEDESESCSSILYIEQLFTESVKVEYIPKNLYSCVSELNHGIVQNESVKKLESWGDKSKSNYDNFISENPTVEPEHFQDESKIGFSVPNVSSARREEMEKELDVSEDESDFSIPNIEKFFQEESVLELEYWEMTLKLSEIDCSYIDDFQVTTTMEQVDSGSKSKPCSPKPSLGNLSQSHPTRETVRDNLKDSNIEVHTVASEEETHYLSQELTENVNESRTNEVDNSRGADVTFQTVVSVDEIILEGELNVKEELSFDTGSSDVETLSVTPDKSGHRIDYISESSTVKPKVFEDCLAYTEEGQMHRVKSADSFDTISVERLPTQSKNSINQSNEDFESDSTSLSGNDLSSDLEEPLRLKEGFYKTSVFSVLNNYLGDEFENGHIETLSTTFHSDREPYYKQVDTILTSSSSSLETDSLNYKVVFPIRKPTFSPESMLSDSSIDDTVTKRYRSFSDPSYNSSHDKSTMSDRFNVDIKIPSFIVCEPAKSISKSQKSWDISRRSNTDDQNLNKPEISDSSQFSENDESFKHLQSILSPIRPRYCFPEHNSESTTCESPYISKLKEFELIPQSSPIVRSMSSAINVAEQKNNSLVLNSKHENVICTTAITTEDNDTQSGEIETDFEIEISSCFIFRTDNVDESEYFTSFTNSDYHSLLSTQTDEEQACLNGKFSGYEGDIDETQLTETFIWSQWMNSPTSESNTEKNQVESYISESNEESEMPENNEEVINVVADLDNSGWANFKDSLNISTVLDLSQSANLMDDAELSYISAASVDEDLCEDTGELTYSSVLYTHYLLEEDTSSVTLSDQSQFSEDSLNGISQGKRNCCPYSPLAYRNPSTLPPIPESDSESDEE